MATGSDVRTDVRSLELTRQPRLSSQAVPYLLSTADAVVILAFSVLSGIGYQLAAGRSLPELLPHCAVGLMASFIYILRMSGAGYYDFPDSAKPNVEISEILVCWFTTGLLLAFFAFLLKVGVDYSRGAFILFYFLAPVGLLGIRKATKTWLIKAVSQGAIGRNDVLLLGDFGELDEIEPRDLVAFSGAPEISRFSLTRDSDPTVRVEGDLAVLKSVASFVRRNNCKEIMLSLPWADADRIEFLREHLKTLPVAVRLLPDSRVRALTNYSSSARRRVLAIEIQRAPLSGSERTVKRLMDIICASLALVVLSPIMLFAALAIKMDSAGPVIFRQTRKGFNGEQFLMFKFRTMVVQENGPTVVQATENDPRVTAIGRLLRSSSIDELPQLINVLMGDMSLIGPRPHALAHDTYFEQVLGDYAFRHHVKPGITGWAQCNGARGATPTVAHIAERVKLDLWYINNWSLWLDVQILAKTFFAVVRKRNAY